MGLWQKLAVALSAIVVLGLVAADGAAPHQPDEAPPASTSSSQPDPTTSPLVRETKLTQVPLAGNAVVLVRPSAADADPGERERPGRGRPDSLRIIGATVAPAASLQLQPDSPAILTLNSSELKLQWNGAAAFSLVGPQGTRQLRSAGGALEPTGIVVGGQRYVLAFPVVTRSSRHANIWYRSGAVQQASLGPGRTVSFFDSNTDGVYGLDDAMTTARLAGAVAVFAPISKHVSLGGRIYEIRSIAADGSRFEHVASSQPTVKLSSRFVSSGSDLYMAVGSRQAEQNAVLVAGVSGASDSAVLPGDYEILYGLVYSPSLHKPVAIVSGGSEIAVAVGRPVVVNAGAPFRLEFAAKGDGQKVTVNPGSFRLSGKGGEVYSQYKWLSGKPPEVALLLDGKPVARLGRMGFG